MSTSSNSTIDGHSHGAEALTSLLCQNGGVQVDALIAVTLAPLSLGIHLLKVELQLYETTICILSAGTLTNTKGRGAQVTVAGLRACFSWS